MIPIPLVVIFKSTSSIMGNFYVMACFYEHSTIKILYEVVNWSDSLCTRESYILLAFEMKSGQNEVFSKYVCTEVLECNSK